MPGAPEPASLWLDGGARWGLLALLQWQDHAVIAAYLLAMLAIGFWLARRPQQADDYFLGGRRLPWLAVGLSVLASLLSSLTYLSEPGEVWQSGVTNLSGRLLAVPVVVLFVWAVVIPFFMRFRFTSAYDYLEHRFGPRARRLGVALFSLLAVCWMGFVLLVSSRALAAFTGYPLAGLIAVLGVVSTAYTLLGGIRAVVWTDVVQVGLMVGGAVLTLAFVTADTGTFVPDWLAAAHDHLAARGRGSSLPIFSADPFMRSTVVTVALHYIAWHCCTQSGNQMTLQRYFSTASAQAARRSFLVGAAMDIVCVFLLVAVGLAMVFYYTRHLHGQLPPGVHLDRRKELDLVFPLFVVNRLAGGLAGAIVAAILAAAMSSIDSAVNSLASVLCARRPLRGHAAPDAAAAALDGTLGRARVITLASGAAITGAAYLLDLLPSNSNILEMMQRSFNCFTGPLGGLMLAGVLLPWTGERAAIGGTLAGLTASVCLAYGRELFALPGAVSFTWVVPGGLLATLTAAALLGLMDRAQPGATQGLTWATRRECFDADGSGAGPAGG